MRAAGLGFCLLLFAAPAHAAEEDCARAVAALNTRLAAGRHESLRASYDRVQAACPNTEFGETARCAGRLAARALLDAAKSEAEIEAALGYGPLWQGLEALGDAASRRGGETEAAGHYQLAMNELAVRPAICDHEEAELGAWSEVKMRETVTRLRAKAARALLLAEEFVAPPANRDGNSGGIFLGEIRGIGAEEVPLPVQFVYKTAEFTDKGKAAFAALVTFLKQRNRITVALSGHTDAVGGDAYNCELSGRRLAAMTQALGREIPGLAVIAYAVGEHAPFEPDSLRAYRPEELDELNRRVVLLDGDTKPRKVCP